MSPRDFILRRSAWIAMLWAAGAAAGRSPDPPAPLGRYRPIVERMPFGAPAAEAPEPPPSPGASRLRLSALLDTESGLRAGLVDTERNRFLYLAPGESEEGIELLSVDLEKETARIRRDGQIYSLEVESAPAAAVVRPAPPGPPSVTVTTVGGATDAETQERIRVALERRRELMERMRQQRERQAAGAEPVRGPGRERFPGAR